MRADPRVPERSRTTGGDLRPSRSARLHLPGMPARSVARALLSTHAVQALARIGFGAKAILYGTVGFLGLLDAVRAGGFTTDTKGALGWLASSSTGAVVAVGFAIALAALGLDFVLEAIADPQHRTGWYGMLGRIGQAAGGIGYGAIATWAAFRLRRGAPGPNDDVLAREWTAQALSFPGGDLGVFVAGVIGLVIGFHQVRTGLRRDFWKTVHHPGHPALHRIASWAGPIGFCTQGSVFAVVGVGLLHAAIAHDPAFASGFGGALASVAELVGGGLGRLALGAAAVGLLAYAVFAGVEGAYRRFPER